jgi:DNA-directed RNA polymerase sigma subunit (sigma70/sigma32)
MSANWETRVDSPVELYESHFRTITDVCADPWFAEQFAAFRGGDEMAWRRISGSCLDRVLEIAKGKWQPGSALGLLDLVQEGNVVLVRTIKRFKGSTAAEFLSELTKQVEARLTVVVEHPDLLR